ncbi:hypothetical protein [Chitinophaga nivalis]|uniref:Uncharacterized protein n=1 Tax=Chitinophaga nivalis TaxID=2991709 RepID=A0ABT3IT54_9BACT|nr:hypothetical protein [Chitinophaga nivalis]MCW3463153.1 hypothetical protein [Chitinophaga nivalis]MCW3487157.1 hypothetical protein [Chitinophaga nivalis]
MTKVLIVVTFFLIFQMNVTGQISATSFNGVALHTNIKDIPGCISYKDFAEKHLFSAEPDLNFYYLPIIDSQDSLIVKYVFLQCNNDKELNKIFILIDDSNNNALSILKRVLGPEHTTGQSSMGQPYGNIVYGWSTNAGTTVLMFKEGREHSVLNFPVTTITIRYKSDYEALQNTSISPVLHRSF